MSKFEIRTYRPEDPDLIEYLEDLTEDDRYISLLMGYLPNTSFKEWCLEYITYHKKNIPHGFGRFPKGWLMNCIIKEGYNLKHIFKILESRINELDRF